MRSISLFTKSFAKILLLVSFLGYGTSALAQDATEGGAIFKQKCTACHAMDKKLVGPALKGIHETRDEEWLTKWIKNSQAMVAAGDPEAVKIFNEYNKIAMPSFPELTDDNVKSLIAYFKAESEKPAAPAGGAAGAAGAGAQTKDEVSNFMLGGLIVVIIVALLVIIVLNRVIGTLERILLQKQGLYIEEEEAAKEGKDRLASLKVLAKNKKFVFFVVMLIVIFLGSWGSVTLWNTGVHTGYQPVQPIKFPHDIHAGVNKIDCQYCHSGAYKSKNASIPSANVCMNCHNYVTASEKYNGETSPEIMKIYKALDYNPDTREYGPNQKPIQWIRIHNLPDLAYFNHSQHVSIAGIECQKCHGPVETMNEVYQYSPLTMKWCINCHRETEVNHKDNHYYDNIIKAHDQIKKGEKVTAAVLGGTECVRCHY